MITRLRDWVRARDPGYAALRRAGRGAIVMPAVFAVGERVLGNPVIALFAGFGSFALLILVGFGGSLQDRVRSQAALVGAGAVLVCLGTLASRSTMLATAAMAVAGFCIVFAGVVSSVLAAATVPLLLSFILPVSLNAPASQIPDRLAGWGLAGAASLVAILALWPAPDNDRLRFAVAAACAAHARRLRAEAASLVAGRAAGEAAATGPSRRRRRRRRRCGRPSSARRPSLVAWARLGAPSSGSSTRSDGCRRSPRARRLVRTSPRRSRPSSR